MNKLLSLVPPVALAVALAGTLSGCDLFGAPPTQLEAKLFVSVPSIEDKETLARNLIRQLNIKELKLDNVRIAFDEDKKTYFFRLVGNEALPPALLKTVGAGLAKLNQDFSWQGKLFVEADETVDAFLKTDKREFPIVASWHKAEVEVYLLRSMVDVMLARRIGALEQPDLPKRAACTLSFTPKDPLPELEGKLTDVVPSMKNTIAALRMAAMQGDEMTVPHRVSFVQPALAELEAPVVEEGKVVFKFAEIEDANISVIGGVGGSASMALDHGTAEVCRRKLGEIAPAVQKLLDRASALGDIAGIGRAQLVALPRTK